MKTIWVVLLAGLASWILFLCPKAVAEEAASVVVLDMDGGDTGMSDEQRTAMSDRLAGVMTKSGKYNVIPRDKFKAAVADREAKSGKPCTDDKCLSAVAKSLGAKGVITPKAKKDGGGCSVSLGASGGAGGSVKNKCSAKFMNTAMDGAMLQMTHKMMTDKPLDGIAEAQADEGQKSGPKIVDLEAFNAAKNTALENVEGIEEVEYQEEGEAEDEAMAEMGEGQAVDKEAEAAALKMEADAAKKMGY